LQLRLLCCCHFALLFGNINALSLQQQQHHVNSIRTRSPRSPTSTALGVVSSGYFPEPTFRVMHTGEGSLSILRNDNDDTTNNINGKNKNDTTGSSSSSPSVVLGDCQFAQFGPRESFTGRIEMAYPPEAHTTPLSPLRSNSKTILVVKRGLCSFESKMRAAVDVGAVGVILVNQDDETFLAVADVPEAVVVESKKRIDDDDDDVSSARKLGEEQPPPQQQREIPFVVVSSSVGMALIDGVCVSIVPLDEGISKCWGSWKINDDHVDNASESLVVSNNNETKGREGPKAVAVVKEEDDTEEIVLPLFPVSKEPLIPGTTLKMQLGRRERDELLEHYSHTSNNNNNQFNDNRIVRVAVAFCTNPVTNLMAEIGTIASVDVDDLAPTGKGRAVTLKGLEPCFLRTLVRDSTKTSFGLGLVHKKKKKKKTENTELATNNNNNNNNNKSTVQTIRERLRLAGYTACEQSNTEEFCDMNTIDLIDLEIDSALPQDYDDQPDDMSFAACNVLNLPSRQLQAVLACSMEERFAGVGQILSRVEGWNDVNYTGDEEEEEGDEDNGLVPSSSRNFVSNAVKKVLPSVVRVELSSGGISGSSTAGEHKAAGFIVGSDGIIVTNRHVVATAGSGVESSAVVLVTFQDGVTLPATILAISESYDICFLKVVDNQPTPIPPNNNNNDNNSKTTSTIPPTADPHPFPTAPIGNGNDVQLGDWMIAVGSPAEFDNFVTLGIASTIQRPPKPTVNSNSKLILDRSATFIGTDALFNKGISGGPLLDDKGNVVGMCTYLREDLNGLGFAISINRVVDAAHELLDGRDITVMTNDGRE